MLVPVRGTGFLLLLAINVCSVNVYTECDLYWNKAGGALQQQQNSSCFTNRIRHVTVHILW